MESVRIILDLEQVPVRDTPYAVTEYEGEIVIGSMPRGTVEGNPTVMIMLEDPETNGYLVVQTTLALFLGAADAFRAEYQHDNSQN